MASQVIKYACMNTFDSGMDAILVICMVHDNLCVFLMPKCIQDGYLQSGKVMATLLYVAIATLPELESF
jgi:hypothetical protein